MIYVRKLHSIKRLSQNQVTKSQIFAIKQIFRYNFGFFHFRDYSTFGFLFVFQNDFLLTDSFYKKRVRGTLKSIHKKIIDKFRVNKIRFSIDLCENSQA